MEPRAKRLLIQFARLPISFIQHIPIPLPKRRGLAALDQGFYSLHTVILRAREKCSMNLAIVFSVPADNDTWVMLATIASIHSVVHRSAASESSGSGMVGDEDGEFA